MPTRRSSLAVAALIVLGACSDSNDDLVPNEPETDEEDREIVPGEGGPVD